ncbi:MAG TPA: GNAT family N-acetyltransferase, partial [Roseiarcus sp.]|nr:GNAT family N-acetyltransferase [Roseiarcus sp.]
MERVSVKAAPRLATRTPRRAAADALNPPAQRRSFAEIEIFHDLEAARPVFAAIEAEAIATPYQGYDFVDAWLRTIGQAQAKKPLIVVLRDDGGRVTGILPLAVASRFGLRTAAFVGGKHANSHMGVFCRGVPDDRETLGELLPRIGRLAGLDALLFVNQPQAWQGQANPLAALGRQQSPSRGHATKLYGDFEKWFALHYSKDAQKKLRKKARRLAEMGAVATVVASDEAMAAGMLSSFFAQKRAQAETTARANDFDALDAERFLEILAAARLQARHGLELHALFCGERIVAVFGGLAVGDRFSGTVTSHEADPEIARCSPGELLILEVVRDLTERGFATFDLGVGEARYKATMCEIE